MGLVDMPFEIANIQCENPEAAAHTRIGWFRSVSNIPRAFAVQSMVGELAHATNAIKRICCWSSSALADRQSRFRERPVELWRALRQLSDRYRTSAPCGRGRRRQRRLGTDRAQGTRARIAVHRSFVSYIATIVEVSVGDKGKLTVHQVDTAIDCGMFVNPERIRAQIEGAAIMGLSHAKYGEITFKDGKVQQGNFDDFPVIRLEEAPLVTNVHIVPANPDTPPSGVGNRACRPLPQP